MSGRFWSNSHKTLSKKCTSNQRTLCLADTIFCTNWSIYRSSRLGVCCKKGVLRSFKKFAGKHLCQSLFFNIIADLRPAISLEKRLWHRRFPVNFVKILRIPFLTEHLRQLPLYLTFFSLQLADTINNFEVILAAREKEYKMKFVKCFLNVIYFRHSEILHCNFFSPFLSFQSTIGNLFLSVKTIFNWNFYSIATSTVQRFVAKYL